MTAEDVIKITDSLDKKFGLINDSVNNISVRIDNFSDLFKDLSQRLIDATTTQSFWDKYGSGILAGIFGIIGVLLGTIISVVYNARLSKEAIMGRFAVQRKNLIYNPIYKELLQLKNYIGEHRDTCYIDIITIKDNRFTYYDGTNSYYSGTFLIWDEMQMDIRKDYIELSEEINISLNKLKSAVISYMEQRNKIREDFKKVYPRYKINQLFVAANLKQHPSYGEDRTIDLEVPYSIYKKGTNWTDELPKIYRNHSELCKQEYSEVKNAIDELFTKILPLEIDRESFFKSYDILKDTIDESCSKVEMAIKEIINIYEFGKKQI